MPQTGIDGRCIQYAVTRFNYGSVGYWMQRFIGCTHREWMIDAQVGKPIILRCVSCPETKPFEPSEALAQLTK